MSDFLDESLFLCEVVCMDPLCLNDGQIVDLPAGAAQNEGIGESIGNRRLVRSEARLLQRAIRKGWVSEEQGKMVVQEMCQIVGRRGEYTTAERIAAAKVVMRAAKVDVEREANDIAAEREQGPRTVVNVLNQVNDYAGLFGTPGQPDVPQGAVRGDDTGQSLDPPQADDETGGIPGSNAHP
jgi:hypothetical protein